MTPSPPATLPPSTAKSNKTLLIILLVTGGLFVCCICSGLLAALAIPGAMKFAGASKQLECKTQLKALYLAQTAHFANIGDYADTADELGFATTGSTRYTYFAGPELVIAPTSDDGAMAIDEAQLPSFDDELLPGVTGECPQCTFLAACAGDTDLDAALDVWSISSAERMHDGARVPPGELLHDVDDSKD